MIMIPWKFSKNIKIVLDVIICHAFNAARDIINDFG